MKYLCLMLLSHWPFRRQQQRGIPFVRLTKEADYFADVLWCAQEGKRIFSSNKRTYPVMALSFSSSSLLSKQFSFEKLFEEEEREIGGGILVHFGPNDGVTDWLPSRFYNTGCCIVTERGNLVRVVIFAELLADGRKEKAERQKWKCWRGKKKDTSCSWGSS